MSTLIDSLQRGAIPDYFPALAEDESTTVENLVERIKNGTIVIPANNLHTGVKPTAIGTGMRIKVNANIGTAPTKCDFDDEMLKTKVAIDAGADSVMDLSIAGDIREFRNIITTQFHVPLGTVPIYEAMIGIEHPRDLTIDHFLKVIQKQAEEKVDFMTIHAGLLFRHLPLVDKRLLGIVSRGGSIMAQWMRHHQTESFLYEHFDDILAIAREYDITMSLGDGLRPGCTADANDAAQFGELEALGELVQRCQEAHVQVMVEGPGHVPYHLIEENVRKQKAICNNAPFYVLGPLVIDYAVGYDHIAGAIGGALAAHFGADFLCYVTPAEHLRLPTLQDVREGVIASKIAAAAVDLTRGHPAEIERNRKISQARKDFDWDAQQSVAIDPAKFCDYLEKVEMDGDDRTTMPCSMCGDWCAIKRNYEAN
ncbi:phosphomethylpyrimidine synthase ThiC [candidate division KSB1 bacterium]|nr:phosphomethylpyrimidine synthase ThiC [candidate division KSB1 bacterium]